MEGEQREITPLSTKDAHYESGEGLDEQKVQKEKRVVQSLGTSKKQRPLRHLKSNVSLEETPSH